MSTRFGSLARAALTPVAPSLAFALGLGLPLTLAAPATLDAQETLADLRPAVEARAAEHRGVVGVAAIDLVRGDTLALQGDERFPTASVIKVPILVEMFQQVETGPLSLDDPVVALEADLKPGSGILQYLSTPHHMTLRDAALLMIAHSDNTASNLVIHRVGIGAVNARMDSLGLPRTRLYRQLFGQNAHSFAPDSAARYGVGVTTPLEMARLFARIHAGEAVSEAASAEMVEMLHRQLYRESIPRHLGDATVANKNGSDSGVRNDCAIVQRDAGDFVLCVFTKENQDRSWRLDHEGHLVAADIARIIHERLGR